MVTGHHDGGNLEPQSVKKHVRRLELAVASPLAQIAGDRDGRRIETGQKFFERLDLPKVGVAAEMEIGEVRNDDRNWAQPRVS
jgi:hypothetical protein